MTETQDAMHITSAQADAIAVLIAHAEGRISHDYSGHCPDGHCGADSRAPNCPVCKALSVCAALAKDTKEQQ